MGRLKLECLQKKVKTTALCKAVYTVLCQKDKIKAELVFNTPAEMQNLNNSARGVDSVTDVLSFPSLDNIKGMVLRADNFVAVRDGNDIFIGSIVLCEDKITEQAKEYGNTFEQERDYLIIHGLLHLFGYDHMTEEDKKEMREKEKAVLAVLNAKKKED